jgi:hypothetical protein
MYIGKEVCRTLAAEWRKVRGDGNCLFHALFLIWQQLEPSETSGKGYEELKNKVCFQSITFVTFLIILNIQLADFISENRDFYSLKIGAFLNDSPDESAFQKFVDLTRQKGEYGDQLHICAFALLFKCCIVVHKNSVFASVVYLPLC